MTDGDGNRVQIYDLPSTTPVETISGQGFPYSVSIQNKGKPRDETVYGDQGTESVYVFKAKTVHAVCNRHGHLYADRPATLKAVKRFTNSAAANMRGPLDNPTGLPSPIYRSSRKTRRRRHKRRRASVVSQQRLYNDLLS